MTYKDLLQLFKHLPPNTVCDFDFSLTYNSKDDKFHLSLKPLAKDEDEQVEEN